MRKNNKKNNRRNNNKKNSRSIVKMLIITTIAVLILIVFSFYLIKNYNKITAITKSNWDTQTCAYTCRVNNYSYAEIRKEVCLCYYESPKIREDREKCYNICKENIQGDFKILQSNAFMGCLCLEEKND